ncbi:MULTISPECIES: heat shock protein transcriptional repressor HspR [Sulfurospirillum]|uniref:Heat shock protein HspR n=3 Tax=Sulfurospirillum TaxID=57665 RepID=A0AA86DYH5_SULMK|nr:MULTISPECIES: helix-turn-helix transcriptional regulator [Sulfurospirillum]AHJ13218.1 putative heat shock protein HspR [Sulfurospirillum multivorans DSM 12446]AOO65508.1 putative heat shock protein HspR [Sulfurospirillum halorespirans DSM 13726]QEH06706.1 putative heat shock protein HspR [Sulfurospirillum multivorans]
MHHGYEEPVYLISVVAKVLTIHPQTLRQYEREGLVRPSRTDGKMRLYSQQDIDKIKMIQRLTRDLGVNLAGVDIIMQLKDKIDDFEVLVESLRMELSGLTKKSTQTKNPLVKHKNSYEIILFGE